MLGGTYNPGVAERKRRTTAQLAKHPLGPFFPAQNNPLTGATMARNEPPSVNRNTPESSGCRKLVHWENRGGRAASSALPMDPRGYFATPSALSSVSRNILLQIPRRYRFFPFPLLLFNYSALLACCNSIWPIVLERRWSNTLESLRSGFG